MSRRECILIWVALRCLWRCLPSDDERLVAASTDLASILDGQPGGET